MFTEIFSVVGLLVFGCGVDPRAWIGHRLIAMVSWGKDDADTFYWYYGEGPDGLKQGEIKKMWWPVRILNEEV